MPYIPILFRDNILPVSFESMTASAFTLTQRHDNINLQVDPLVSGSSHCGNAGMIAVEWSPFLPSVTNLHLVLTVCDRLMKQSTQTTVRSIAVGHQSTLLPTIMSFLGLRRIGLVLAHQHKHCPGCGCRMHPVSQAESNWICAVRGTVHDTFLDTRTVAALQDRAVSQAWMDHTQDMGLGGIRDRGHSSGRHLANVPSGVRARRAAGDLSGPSFSDGARMLTFGAHGPSDFRPNYRDPALSPS
ncbi:hypothetical protein DFH06DRAFT_324936 [Mycena polygramma]|nr:hypothetical protein DFH06DRAFT_324936 [Mycena polygramma]